MAENIAPSSIIYLFNEHILTKRNVIKTSNLIERYKRKKY